MAFDLLRGKTVDRSWARGDSSSAIGDWVADKVTEVAKGKIPWKPVAVVAGVLAGLFVIPKLIEGRKRREGVPQHEFDPNLPETTKVPHESMRDTVYRGR